MKTPRLPGLVLSALFAVAVASAAEKEITLTGLGQCAKCSLGKTESCQNALVLKRDGKDEVYLLTENEVSKKFHDEVCDAAKLVRVTGVVHETKGQKEITASKIELVKGSAG